MTDIDEILKKINPKTAQSFQIASNIETEIMKTPSLGINIAMGGITYGRFITLYGNKGSGKTLFALQCVAEAQKLGKTVAWLDVEKNFNKEWAKSLGVDTDRMLVDNKTISIAGMADKACEVINAGVDVLVIDSISQLLPQSFFEDAKSGSEELKGLGESQQIGTYSKNIGQAINMINSINENTLVILISQIRNKIGSYGASIGYMGGHALEHANSTVIRLWRSPKEVIEEEVLVGDNILLKRPVGYSVTWTIEKNRGPGMNESNSYDVYTSGDYKGVDLIGEIVTYGVEYGIIKKGGAWFTVGEERFQGRANVIKYLRNNPDVKEKIYGEIIAKSI